MLQLKENSRSCDMVHPMGMGLPCFSLLSYHSSPLLFNSDVRDTHGNVQECCQYGVPATEWGSGATGRLGQDILAFVSWMSEEDSRKC